MKWRTALRVLPVLLLPLPLLWLLSLFMSAPEIRSPVFRGKAIAPMLSLTERLRLRTYEAVCQTDGDCEAPLRCFYNGRTERSYCADSTCLTSDDCLKGFACRVFRAENGTDIIRNCSLEGYRTEGELCEQHPSRRELGCEKGLICTDTCGRVCRLDDSSSCPDGFICKDSDNGPTCRPTCEGRPCPEGQRCISSVLGGVGSACLKVYGMDCELNPCPQGFRCDINTHLRAPGKVWMECLSDCASSEPLCPEGRACSLFQCRQACEPNGSPVCAPGFRCKRKGPDEPWSCMPDPRTP